MYRVRVCVCGTFVELIYKSDSIEYTLIKTIDTTTLEL